MNRAQRTQMAMASLRKANAIRADRAELKHELAAGRLSLEEVLAEPPECCSNVKVFDALQWARGIGYESARKIARGLVSETLTIRCMGPATRRQLLERVQAKGALR